MLLPTTRHHLSSGKILNIRKVTYIPFSWRAAATEWVNRVVAHRATLGARWCAHPGTFARLMGWEKGMEHVPSLEECARCFSWCCATVMYNASQGTTTRSFEFSFPPALRGGRLERHANLTDRFFMRGRYMCTGCMYACTYACVYMYTCIEICM